MALNLVISICATQGYTYAMRAQARRVQQCIATAQVEGVGHVVLSGDNSPELREVAEHYRALLPERWKVVHVACVADEPAAERPHKDRDDEKGEDRKRRAFRRIADLREAAHACALKLGATHLWSLDSDVLPPANALRASFGALAFDGGWYSVAFCPYPNLQFLGGFGSPEKNIEEDFLPHERRLPRRLRLCLETCQRRLAGNGTIKEAKRRVRLEARARKCPPEGSVWEVTAKRGWRRRGWLDNAYPGIGLGALVPSDWCGFGCTLMTRDAFAMADFSGFAGHGTEDLWVVWKHWHPAGLRIAVLPHCPCDHVYWSRQDGKDERMYLRAYHEPSGECRGHLRVARSPWP